MTPVRIIIAALLVTTSLLNAEKLAYFVDTGNQYRGFWEVDTVTGQRTRIVNLAGQSYDTRLVGIAQRRSDWALYALQSQGQALYQLNIDSGAMLRINALATPIYGIAFHPATEELYGTSRTDLYKINLANAALTLIGPTLHEITTIGFSPGGKLYGMAPPVHGISNGAPYTAGAELYQIDAVTGNAALIGGTTALSSWAREMVFKEEEAFYTMDYLGDVFRVPVATGLGELLVELDWNTSGVDGVFLSRPKAQLSIAVSHVRLCWETITNKNYQLQYSSEVTSNMWVDLGGVRVGDGSRQCLTNEAGDRRFYRILEVQ